MPGNRGVAYMGPGKVEITDLDYPELVLKDGPGVNGECWSQGPPRGDSEVRIHQHLRQRSAYGPRSNHGAGWAGAGS